LTFLSFSPLLIPALIYLNLDFSCFVGIYQRNINTSKMIMDLWRLHFTVMLKDT